MNVSKQAHRTAGHREDGRANLTESAAGAVVQP